MNIIMSSTKEAKIRNNTMQNQEPFPLPKRGRSVSSDVRSTSSSRTSRRAPAPIARPKSSGEADDRYDTVPKKPVRRSMSPKKGLSSNAKGDTKPGSRSLSPKRVSSLDATARKTRSPKRESSQDDSVRTRRTTSRHAGTRSRNDMASSRGLIYQKDAKELAPTASSLQRALSRTAGAIDIMKTADTSCHKRDLSRTVGSIDIMKEYDTSCTTAVPKARRSPARSASAGSKPSGRKPKSLSSLSAARALSRSSSPQSTVRQRVPSKTDRFMEKRESSPLAKPKTGNEEERDPGLEVEGMDQSFESHQSNSKEDSRAQRTESLLGSQLLATYGFGPFMAQAAAAGSMLSASFSAFGRTSFLQAPKRHASFSAFGRACPQSIIEETATGKDAENVHQEELAGIDCVSDENQSVEQTQIPSRRVSGLRGATSHDEADAKIKSNSMPTLARMPSRKQLRRAVSARIDSSNDCSRERINQRFSPNTKRSTNMGDRRVSDSLSVRTRKELKMDQMELARMPSQGRLRRAVSARSASSHERRTKPLRRATSDRGASSHGRRTVRRSRLERAASAGSRSSLAEERSVHRRNTIKNSRQPHETKGSLNQRNSEPLETFSKHKRRSRSPCRRSTVHASIKYAQLKNLSKLHTLSDDALGEVDALSKLDKELEQGCRLGPGTSPAEKEEDGDNEREENEEIEPKRGSASTIQSILLPVVGMKWTPPPVSQGTKVVITGPRVGWTHANTPMTAYDNLGHDDLSSGEFDTMPPFAPAATSA